MQAGFTELVEDAMRSRGIGLRALCRDLKLDPSFFSKVLAGKRSPPSEEAVLRRLAALLGLDPIELVVSTGRIPEEWVSLLREPATIETLRALAAGMKTPRPARAAPRAVPMPAPVAAPRRPQAAAALSDELL